jgi:hypothetical protein
MRDPQKLRNLGRRCLELAKSSVEPEVIEQLRCWAIELADAADEVEREAREPSETSICYTNGGRRAGRV